MFKTLRNAWAIPDLRKKMLYTLIMIFIFRLGSFIPVPGLAKDAFSSLLGDGSNGNNLFSMLNMFSGGAFANATIFAMGITPYINSSIIMQLLTVAIPALERLSKEGEEGRKVIAKWTRFVTIILAFIQATGLYFAIRGAITVSGVWGYVLIVTTFTAGTAFLMWLGEQITDKGVGNGISIIIFAGIVAGFPATIAQMVANLGTGATSILGCIAIALVALFMIVFVVFMDNAERRIPVQYAKRMVGRKMYGGQSTHVPIKVVMAGVIPIIFAMSILSFPTTIMTFIGYTPGSGFWGSFWKMFTPSSPVYMVLYFLLIVFFTYFYTAIQFNPVEIANNLKRNGGFVPGIRPGRPTSDYISKILTRITLAGALFLGIIAVLPMALAAGFSNATLYAVGGSSLLIVVGVALETTKQIESQMLMRHYKGFLE